VRRAVAIALIATLAGFGIVTFGMLAAPVVTDADFAVGELYVQLAARATLDVGPYSRFGWHHPGPLYFYLNAPFYALSGHQAATMYAVAVAINIAAIALIGWVIVRESRGPLAAAVVGSCLLFAWRLPNYLASPWTGHVAVLPSVAVLVMAASVAAGRLGWLPLLVAFGSFVTQTHVGFVPVVFVVMVVAAAAGIRRARRHGTPLAPMLGVSALVLLVLWSVPIIEALANRGGNVAALWRFFVTEGSTGHSMREAIVTGSYGLTAILRPDFDLPWAGHFPMTHEWLSVAAALIAIALLIVVARRAFGDDRRFDGWLATMSLAAMAAGILSLTRVRGDILNHDLFRIAAIGTLTLGVIAGAAFGAASAAVRAAALPATLRRAAVGLAVVAVAALGVRDLLSMTAFERRHQQRSPIVPAYDAIRKYIAGQGVRKPLVSIDADRWGEAAGVLLRLVRDGTPVAVKDAHVPTFSTALAPRGDEDALITFANLELHRELRAKPETTVLLQSFPLFVDAARIGSAPPGR